MDLGLDWWCAQDIFVCVCVIYIIYIYCNYTSAKVGLYERPIYECNIYYIYNVYAF